MDHHLCQKKHECGRLGLFEIPELFLDLRAIGILQSSINTPRFLLRDFENMEGHPFFTTLLCCGSLKHWHLCILGWADVQNEHMQSIKHELILS